MTPQTAPDQPRGAAGRPRRHPLDPLFAPRSVAVVGASDRPGSVGRALVRNLATGPLASSLFLVNSEPSDRRGPPRVRERGRDPGADRSRGDRHAGGDGPEIVARVRGRGRRAAPSSSRPASGSTGPAGAELERAGARGGAPRADAAHRPQLPRRHAARRAASTPPSPPAWRGPATSAFLSQSGALCTAILDWSLARAGRLQRLRLDRLDARRRLGRPDRLLRRRPADAQHRRSTWSRSATRARSSRRRARWR